MVQNVVAPKLRSLFNGGYFNTVWLLLDTAEQRRYILEGLKKASDSEARTFWGQDCRALCPEVTVSNFLSEGGKGFVKFLTRFLKTFESSGPYYTSAPTKLMVLSILHDIVHRSDGMKDALHVMDNTPGYFAQSLAETKTAIRDKPCIRCENCTKTPEDIGQGVRFMVCGTCKGKLNFEVHYCSQSCQKEDWPVHKKACGKKKVSKGLSGTKGDKFWVLDTPVADMLRSLPQPRDGSFTIRDIGVGPCKGQRSPAAERQTKMLEADKNVDYFLFTASGEPVRFVIDDPGAKMIFRVVRGMIMTDTANKGVESIAEYILKFMSGYPGLSRDIILKQLCAEYGEGIAEGVVLVERDSRKRGVNTLIESLIKDSSGVFGSFWPLM
ncbi:uncharacterized protein EDB91DRAFT_1084174 [Suillus paluster]|uniref:uncharacterized protein n=1 Tax=Suillus paluster TaxID=48578 RepID=UPI001B8611BE|nr:uncharacterized protein EDB91DRAFT_1084174 [Suillus paluster]KAG1734023.1 hypothetical protein EDB91DRAFT_1084174 [Suillus paluster]